MSLKFGTDGVRGVANAELTPELTMALGRAACRVLGPGPWLVGRDTRVSGPLLHAALAAGLAAEGATVIDLGVAPTPAVAATCAERGLPGAVISASHNPFSDNGIKLFAPGGRKLPDDVEERLESALVAGPVGEVPVGAEVGTLDADHSALGAYADRLVAALEGRRLDGMALVIDCANGAASPVAEQVFRRVGAEVSVLHAAPDGTNINAGCGSTYPQRLQQTVRERPGTALGLAFDGDADRLLAVDANGDIVDGDQILALAALDLRRRGRLAADTVVVTVMSNLGFRLGMEAAGIRVVETQVGDRYVLEALAAGGYSLGGEQSGHVIFPELATTGDGLLTGLLLSDLVRRQGRPLAELTSEAMTKLPQVLRNVRVAKRDALAAAPEIWAEVRAVEEELGHHGRVLLRPSGTEPLVRVMVEAPTHADAEAAVDRIAAAVNDELGTPDVGAPPAPTAAPPVHP
ncbi:MAG: phosphoglucosamine mutase [Actinobacteria bacterium]|nr:phosphoglucosamine mutase [Actinomycetota bacterium]MBW3649930.1 phosphoglucosamine mutase [Actinomycetota bacterium]